MPEVQIDSIEKAARDSDLIGLLEHHMADWAATIATVMQKESAKQPAGQAPLAEIEFWRQRNAVLSSLFEQLNLPNVKTMVAVVEAGSDDRNLMAGFKAQFSELTKLAAEARDNVKFLTTLERHFKNINSGPLPSILDTLPPMMNALRMVWIISQHYSDDVRMGNLFQGIARELGDRVEAAIDLNRVFQMQPQDAVDLVKIGRSVLEHWYLTYMQASALHAWPQRMQLVAGCNTQRSCPACATSTVNNLWYFKGGVPTAKAI
jgi:dynein heavy chain, axonemal